MDKMKKMNFIIIGQQPWDTEIGSNCKDIALELSKHHQVLYVNSPLDRATLVQHRKDQSTKVRLEVVKGERDGLIQIQDNLWNYYPDCIVESINWLRVDFVFDVINKINNKKFYHSILKAVSRLGFV